jgi:hypothetical protein
VTLGYLGGGRPQVGGNGVKGPQVRQALCWKDKRNKDASQNHRGNQPCSRLELPTGTLILDF